jgi:hypothetical protein
MIPSSWPGQSRFSSRSRPSGAAPNSRFRLIGHQVGECSSPSTCGSASKRTRVLAKKHFVRRQSDKRPYFKLWYDPTVKLSTAFRTRY